MYMYMYTKKRYELMCFIFRGASVIVGSSRQTYAFARDGAMPFSKWLMKLTKSKVPANAVWFNIIFSAILGIPYMFSDVAFETIVSVNTIAASISYFIPIWLRITMARKRFQKGPFHMGAFSIPCGIIACLWIILTSCLFVLPTVSQKREEEEKIVDIESLLFFLFSNGQ